MSPRILITGAGGFIGSRLIPCFYKKTKVLVKAVPGRTGSLSLFEDKRLEALSCRNINGSTEWRDVVGCVDAVVHLAARVHVINEASADPMAEFRRVNVEGSLNLGRQAARARVNRFVFISSVGVQGSHGSKPFSINDPPNPVEPYAVSKLEAEQGLRKISEDSGMELVIIRPPLVYGPKAPGNFGRLVRMVHKGLPLPLGLVTNKRSLVAIDNLVDLIMTCIEHPAAAGQTFLVSDGEDLSTPELIRKLAWAMGKKPRLLPVPPSLLRLGGRMIRKKVEMDRLIGTLQVDMTHTCETLHWQPPVSVDEALWKTGRNFITQVKG